MTLRDRVMEAITKDDYGLKPGFIDIAIALVRAETLEEAERKLEALPEKIVVPGSLPIEYVWFGPKQCAAAIRDLKDKP